MEMRFSRRDFLKTAGFGAASLGAMPLMQSCAALGKKSLPPGALYNEKYRPQFHFTPRENWTNDPNGLVYYKGQYHLFFQHNPSGINWGNMTWGHAVSKDLMHWKQLPNAIEPDDLGTIFSGSAVVDWKNTAGFQTGRENVLVAFYTSAGKHAPVKKPFTQSIAYSNDRGRTWVKYKGNPIIGNMKDDDNRDPKVIWHGPTSRWIMALFLDANDEFALLSSEDLKKWQVLQYLMLPGSRECPDFFELPVDGDPVNTRWVFWGANGKYLLGSFDGKKFNSESGPHESRVGNHYAAQTYSNIPESDGRRIQIAWMAKGKFPNMPFNQQMSIPCELKLRTFPEGIRLCMLPVKEIKNIRASSRSWRNSTLRPGENPLSEISEELFEIQAEIEPDGAAEVGFNLRGNPLVYNVGEKTLTCKDRTVQIAPLNGKIKLHILVDRTSIEIFPNDGLMPIFLCFPLDTNNTSLEVFARGGKAKIQNLKLWKLKSIWA
ncbi:MAG TPA: glycoside hydrolase family 32 protein [Sedimentisphaerales bacterium]|nr:glycoside hydrolase family 32 protein [Sedimentisphaerales bacterium]